MSWLLQIGLAICLLDSVVTMEDTTSPVSKETFLYAADSSLMQQVHFLWLNGAWNRATATEYTYDSLHRPTEILLYDYMQSDSVPRMRTNLYYNKWGRILYTVQWTYSPDSLEWLRFAMQEYRYNQQGNRTGETLYLWDESLQNWVGENKFEFELDRGGSFHREWPYSFDGGDWTVVSSINFPKLEDETSSATDHVPFFADTHYYYACSDPDPMHDKIMFQALSSSQLILLNGIWYIRYNDQFYTILGQKTNIK